MRPSRDRLPRTIRTKPSLRRAAPPGWPAVAGHDKGRYERLRSFREGLNEKVDDRVSGRDGAVAFGGGYDRATTVRGGVERHDPSVDALVGAEVKVEKLAEQDGFFEGPVWHRGPGAGFLTFSDVTQNRIFKWDQASGLTTYIDKVFTGKDTSSVITFERNGRMYQQPGPNGQTLDKEGRLVSAPWVGQDHAPRANGSLTMLVAAYNGRHLNAPNDLVYKNDGALYFTDIRAEQPHHGREPARRRAAYRRLPLQGRPADAAGVRSRDAERARLLAGREGAVRQRHPCTESHALRRQRGRHALRTDACSST